MEDDLCCGRAFGSAACRVRGSRRKASSPIAASAKRHKHKKKKKKKKHVVPVPVPVPTLSLALLQQVATEDARQGSTMASNVTDYGANDCHLRSAQQGDCAAGFHYIPSPGLTGVCSWRVTAVIDAASQIHTSRTNVVCGTY